MLRGVDFSQGGGPLDQTTLAAFKANGVSFAVPQYSAILRGHLSALANAGIRSEVYVYLYWGLSPWNQTPQERVHNAIDFMQGYDVRRVWLDCEDKTHHFDPIQLRECIQICRDHGYELGIYTGRWFWTPQTVGSSFSEFGDLPLWDALYLSETPTPDLALEPTSLAAWSPYGPWTKPLIWQWHNTTSFCGHTVDMNVMEEPVDEDQELWERRAGALLDYNLLTHYRTRFTPDGSQVELLLYDGSTTGIFVPVPNVPEPK